jgi:flagellar hook-associated protein 3 FlgL
VGALRPTQEAIEDLLLSSISRAGAIQYRLQVSQSQSAQRFASQENLIARDADVDFAEATIRLNRAQTAYSAAVQSGAKIASTSLLDFIR